MHRIFLISVVALLMTALSISASVPADLSGTWSGRSVPGGDGFPVEHPTPASLIVTQNGSTITGIFTGGEVKAARIESVHLAEDGKITFWLRDSQNYLVTAQLTVSGDWMRGRITTSRGIVMNIALKKQ